MGASREPYGTDLRPAGKSGLSQPADRHYVRRDAMWTKAGRTPRGSAASAAEPVPRQGQTPLPEPPTQTSQELTMPSKLFVWTDALLTGIPLVDEQHQEYFRRVNRALEAVTSPERESEFRQALDFVQSYAMEHFDAEQGVMTVHGYPGYEGHLAQHQVFASRLDALTEALAGEGFAEDLGDRLNALLVEWFVRHIRTEDQRLGRFVRQKLG
jgi:hemerythrin